MSNAERKQGAAEEVEAQWVRVAAASDLDPDGRHACRGRGWNLLLIRQEDEVYAVENRCSHATARLDGGKIVGFDVVCPLHGARFDVRDGSCRSGPATRPINTFPARVTDGEIEVELPPKPAALPGKFGVFN